MSLINLRDPDSKRAPIWVPSVTVMRIEDLASRVSLPALTRPGCYIAIGLPDASDQRPYAMCGEGKNVGQRLMRKIADSGREWDFAVIFGCEQPGWPRIAPKYLEWRFTGVLECAPHFDLQIGQSPQRDHVSEAERRALDNYVLEARRLLVAMGHHFLEPVPVCEPDVLRNGMAPSSPRFDFNELLKPSRLSPTDGPMLAPAPSSEAADWDAEPGPGLKAADPVGSRYRLHYGDLQATAIKLHNGDVLVLKSSEMSATETTTLPRYIREHRATLLATGVVKPHPTDETKFVFTHDEPFRSPSRLAKCLTGSTQGAGAVWRISAADTSRLT